MEQRHQVKPQSPSSGEGVAKVAQARTPALRHRGWVVFLVPRRCVGTRKLRAAEGIGPVSTIRIHGSQTCRLSGVIRCDPEGICSDPCQQLVMGSVSRPEDGGPNRTGHAEHSWVGPIVASTRSPRRVVHKTGLWLRMGYSTLCQPKRRRLFMDSRLVGYFAQIRLLSKPEGRRITYCCC